MPLSQYISQVVSRKERLRGIVLDRTAILSSERALSCTNTLCFDEVSKSAILGLSRSYLASSKILIGVHRVHGCEKTLTACPFSRLFPPGINPSWMECMLWAFPMWWMYSAKSFGNSTLSCNVGSTRVPPECPWISRKYKKCLEELRFMQYWNLFFGPPPFCRKVIQSLIDHCEVPSNFALNSSIMSPNRTAPSSSRGIDGSCPSNLIRAFNTAKQSLRNLSGLMSIHFLSRIGIEVGDSVQSRLQLWLCLRNRFPCNSVLNVFKGNGFWRFGYVFCQFRSQFEPTKQRFDHDFNTVTSLMITDFHIRDRADLRVSTNPPLTRDASSLRGNVYSRHRFFISSGLSSSSSVMKSCPFQQSSNRRRCTGWTISDLQEVVRIYVHNLAAGFPATSRWCEDQQSEVL